MIQQRHLNFMPVGWKGKILLFVVHLHPVFASYFNLSDTLDQWVHSTMGENGVPRFVQIYEQHEARAFSEFLLSTNFASKPRPECGEDTHWEEKIRLYFLKQEEMYHKVLQGLNVINCM